MLYICLNDSICVKIIKIKKNIAQKGDRMNYNSDIKENKEFALAKTIMYNLVLSIFITLALSVIAIYVFGLKLDIVLSDSMKPVFHKHDIVIVHQMDDYKVDDIIEFKTSASSQFVTHRVVAKTGSGKNAVYTTKGDGNLGEDDLLIQANQVQGKVIGIIENGEHIYNAIKSNYFLLIDIILGVWVLSSVLNGEAEMRKHNIAKA